MALVAGACYGQPIYVDPAEIERLPFGLFSVSNLIEAGNSKWQQGVEWQPYRCGEADLTGCPTCAQNEAGTNPAKDYTEGVDLDNAFPFTVTGSFLCSPIGSWDEAEERARKALETGAERAVEREVGLGTHIASKALVDASSVDVTPTPGTPVSIAQGLAILEAYIGLESNGQGVILGNRREVMMANSAGPILYVNGSQIQTLLGTPVGAVSGFDARTGPNGTAAGAGEAWLFALGSKPRIWRSDVFLTSAREQSLDTDFNNLAILAEQTYVVGWDCLTAGVLVTSV